MTEKNLKRDAEELARTPKKRDRAAAIGRFAWSPRTLALVAIGLYTLCLAGYDVRPLIRAAGLPVAEGAGCCTTPPTPTPAPTSSVEAPAK